MPHVLRPAGEVSSDGPQSDPQATGGAPTATRFPSLTRQAGALGLGALAAQTSGLVLLMALTRLVPKTELGGYQQLALIYGIVSPLLVAGIPAALLYFMPRAKDEQQAREWVGAAYVLLGAIGLACSIVVVAARGPIADALGNHDLTRALVPYAPYPFFAFVAAVMPTALVAIGRAGLAAALISLGGVLVAIGVLVALVFGRDTAHMAGGLAGGQLITTAVSVYAVYRVVGVSLVGVRLRPDIQAVLRYGLPLALTGLAGKLAFQFDRLVVTQRFSPAEFAIYAVGAVELPLTIVVQQSVNSVLVPALTRHYAAGDLVGMAALWRRAIRRTSLIVLPLFVFFMLTATETIHLLFGASYGRSADVFRIYLLLIPFRVATYGLITQAIGRTDVNLSASFVLLAANAGLVLALVGPMGLNGAALGTVLATLVVVIYYLVRLRRVLGLRIRALFPWSTVAANLALSAAAAIPAAALVLAGLDGFLQLVIAALLFAPSYIGLLILFRRLDAQELAWMARAASIVQSVPERLLRVRPTHGSR
jgi:O-antigen/teichoic acid export membrane protein